VTKTLREIADHCGASLEGDGSRPVVGPADLASAGESEVSFLANPRYTPLLETTGAAGVLVGPGVETRRDDLTLLRVEDPSRAFTAVVGLFAPEELEPEPGVHPTAVVDPSARLGARVSVGAFCQVGPESELGDGVRLLAGVVVGDRVRIGEDSVLHPGVVLYPRVVLGRRCTLHAGAVVGSDGFGYEPTAEGWSKIPQCGTVVIGDDVEIGANATIDRARFGVTRIEDQVKIDNLVQVAHNCELGRAAMLCSQAGLAGTAKVGERAILAGQVGVGGHLEVGAGARVGGQGGVTSDVPAGADYAGWPARPMREAMKEIANARRIPRLKQEIETLRRGLAELEERLARFEGGGER